MKFKFALLTTLLIGTSIATWTPFQRDRKVYTSAALEQDVAGIQIAIRAMANQNYAETATDADGNLVIRAQWAPPGGHHSMLCKVSHFFSKECVWTRRSKEITVTLHLAELMRPTMWPLAQYQNRFGIDMQGIIEGFGDDKNLIGAKADKSGGFFKFTPNKRYMVKGIFGENVRAWRRIGASYISHLAENPESKLVPIVAVFTVRGADGKKAHFCIMKNAFSNPIELQRNGLVFDIKGRSSRQAESEDAAIKKEHELVKAFSDESAFNVQRRVLKTNIEVEIKKDVEFLEKQGMFDYSAVLGFYGDGDVEVGLIDTLTEYTFLRTLEHWFKWIIGKEFSGARPVVYAKRFLAYLDKYGFKFTLKKAAKKANQVLGVLGRFKTWNPKKENVVTDEMTEHDE